MINQNEYHNISLKMKSYPYLDRLWENNSSEVISFASRENKPHQLWIKQLLIQGKVEWTLALENGLNDISEIPEIRKYEFFSLIKLCLTGKNELSHSVKELIHNIFLQIELDRKIYTICISLEKRISGAIYSLSIKDILNMDALDLFAEARAEHLKELQDMLKCFFSKHLELPYLVNGTDFENRYNYHPITFATYYSFLFLDQRRLFKVFDEDQSHFWRKRTFQVLIGLRGIPVISFFQTLLAENESNIYQYNKIKKDIEEIIHKIPVSEQNNWQKKYIQLAERKNKLIDLKISLIDKLEEQYHLSTERKLDMQVHECQSRLNVLQTKEIQIINEIHSLGGNFQPHRKSKKNPHHEIDNKNQISLFLQDYQHSNENKDKIDQLIGDYYLNLSQIEILEADILELRLRKENEIKKTHQLEEKNSSDIYEMITSIDKEINDLLNDNTNLNTLSPNIDETMFKKPLFNRNLNAEKQFILECINHLKSSFREEHEKDLIRFFQSLKENLQRVNPLNILSVSINKQYIPKIIYEEHGEILFTNLPDDQKRIFILTFYITILEHSLNQGGLNPSLLLLSISDSSIHLDHLLNTLIKRFQKPFQMIVSNYKEK